MIDPQAELSVRRQCELLSVPRSGLYYDAVTENEGELALMRRIDELHLAHPFYGTEGANDFETVGI
jgi:putative transposase